MQGHWRKKQEISPLQIEEGTSEPKKLDLKPLPMELKYAYLEEQEQYPIIISSLLSTSQEDSLLDILRKNKQAIGWKITDLKGISPVVCTHHIYLEEEAKSSKATTEENESSYAGSGSSRGPKVAISRHHLPHIR